VPGKGGGKGHAVKDTRAGQIAPRAARDYRHTVAASRKNARKPAKVKRSPRTIRRQYERGVLSEKDLTKDPLELFSRWLDAAIAAKVDEPTALTLATATPDGIPSARTVLLKDVDQGGFVFFTNYGSKKGRELAANGECALVFLWKPLERQVIVAGTAKRVSREESDAYFKSRPKGSRMGAWASPQSEVIPDRAVLERRVKEMEKQYGKSGPPLPPNWGGFRVWPREIEFWQGRVNRLHDRFRYSRSTSGWKIERLAP
jgi:pyridoxamine 5'-phosphate oxidase